MVRPGRENMAVDEFLIDWCGRTGRPAARFYAWRPAAVSIGRYQSVSCLNQSACRRLGIDIVRRITGGGAIYHDREITYAVVCPEESVRGEDGTIGESYRRINSFIMNTYRALGLHPDYAKDAGALITRGASDFCFCGNEAYDIIVSGRKIGGGAQRRTRGVVLQHGSLPYAIDREMIARCFTVDIDDRRFASLEELIQRPLQPDELIDILLASLASSMGWETAEEPLNEEEEALVQSLARRRYSSDEWNIAGEELRHDAPKAVLA